MADWNFRVGNSIVNKYVKSLYEVSVSYGIEKIVVAQLKSLKNCVLSLDNHEKILEKFSLVPKYGEDFIEQLKVELKLLKEVGNFLALLLKNKRLSLIVEICDAYFLFIDTIKGKKIFFITHAAEFSAADKKQLIGNFCKVFGGKIECISRKDLSLIGGIKIQFRSKILDYSIKSRLARLRQAIKGGSYED
ncbi:MAG: ATP synthase F1 subunit delta [Holosporaceae bacterium]|jgi:F-type H+-transporting ATPase subunit delta|nr:ATP synthase F1 subunit delta [Holosporaceae bacterium]